MFNVLYENNHQRSVHPLLCKAFTSLDGSFNNLILILISLKPRHMSPSEDGDIHFPSSETFKSVGIFRLDFGSKHSEVAIDALSLHPPTMSSFILP